MYYNLSIDLYTDGDFDLSEDIIKQENGLRGFEEYHFNWTIQTNTFKEAVEIIVEKVKSIQKAVIIYLDYIEDNIDQFFDDFYYNLSQNQDIKYPISSHMYGDYDGTHIRIAKTNFITT